jgi:ABC-type bacteriocin/lantibiotic exporter with double-glycine peptidase domain
VTAAGWFKVRIADGDHPTARTTISRSELLQHLGAQSWDAILEAGVVHPERPAQPLAAEHPNPLNPHEDSHTDHTDHAHPSPAQRFLELLKTERQHIGSLLIFSVFSGLLYLAAPLAVDAVVSNLAFGGQSAPYVQALVILTFALLGCLALQAVVSAFQYYLSEIIQRRIFVRTAADLAYRLPRVQAEAVDKVHAPELVNRFLEVVTAQKSTALILLDGVNVVFGSLAGMLLLAFYHPALLALVAILLFLIVVVIWPLGRNAVKTSIAESKLKYELVNWFEQIAGFPLLFRGPGGHALASDRANFLAASYLEKRGTHFRVVIRQVIGLLVLSVSASAAVLLLGGWLVLSQQLTIGQLAASELIMGGIAASLAKLGKKLEAWYDAMAAMDKLGHLLDLPIEREDGERPPVPNPDSALVQACNLSFSYEGQSPLFSDLSFTLTPGSRTALVGPHGSGASSLLDLLFGLRSATSGHLSVDQLDLRNWYLEGLRETVQLLRRGEIVEGSVLENLKLGRETLGTDECYAALARVGLLDHLLHRPEGLNLQLRSGGAPLSTTQCPETSAPSGR